VINRGVALYRLCGGYACRSQNEAALPGRSGLYKAVLCFPNTLHAFRLLVPLLLVSLSFDRCRPPGLN